MGFLALEVLYMMIKCVAIENDRSIIFMKNVLCTTTKHWYQMVSLKNSLLSNMRIPLEQSLIQISETQALRMESSFTILQRYKKARRFVFTIQSDER